MKFQAIVLASFLVMPYALADDQGGLKQDAVILPGVKVKSSRYHCNRLYSRK